MENQFNISKDQYQKLIFTWSTIKNHTAAQHIAYNILRSKPADLGFSPLKSENKIRSNFENPNIGFDTALASLKETLPTQYTDPYWIDSKARRNNISIDEQRKRDQDAHEYENTRKKTTFTHFFGIELTDEIINLINSIGRK